MNENAKRAMLCELRVSTWTARKQDKRMAKAVSQSKHIADHMGSYYKSLVDSPELKEVNRLTSAARNAHYVWTLPWMDSGPRVLPSAAFYEYSQEIAEYRNAFYAAVDRFAEQYPAQKEAARQLLGESYSEQDYPPVELVRSKFGFQLHFSPLPMGDDFRCEIGAESTEQIRQQIEQNTHESITRAVTSLYSRMADVVQHFVDRLGDEDTVFRDSLVENARSLVSIMPRLNLTDDPDVDALTERIEQCLCAYDPDSLRRNKALRSEVHQEAAAIQDDLADFLRG